MAHPHIPHGLIFLALGGLSTSKLIKGQHRDLCGNKTVCTLPVEVVTGIYPCDVTTENYAYTRECT